MNGMNRGNYKWQAIFILFHDGQSPDAGWVPVSLYGIVLYGIVFMPRYVLQFMTSFSRLSVFTANLMQLAPGCLCCLSYTRGWNYILLSPGFVCLQEDGVPRIWPFWELFGCRKTGFVSRSNKCPNTIIFPCYFHKHDLFPQRPCYRGSHQSDDYWYSSGRGLNAEQCSLLLQYNILQ